MSENAGQTKKRNYGGQKLAITIEMNSGRFVVT
jgi:hypothetical protein